MTDGNDVAAVEVFVDGEAWTTISCLAEAGPEDTVFALDPENGKVVFGDGVHGKQPPAGANVIASYRQGGGTVGNVGLSITTCWPFERCMHLVIVTDRGFQIRSAKSIVESCSGEKRPRYFEGQMLSASDLQAEQNYFLRQSHRHNRLLHGAGIVSGLEITVVGDAEHPSIVVSPGYAIDPEGRELIVREPILLCIPDEPSPQCVAVKYLEKEKDYIPSPNQDHIVPSRIEDCALALILPEPAKYEVLIIGRVLKSALGWQVDPTFQLQRPR